ncbi:hypothetical protein Q4Q35_20125 [Flavivirga aquimarina]|uniref:Uncharacterized protein n=1 Tax=Flavivirga aquimarina TaxID=2027862 RepID=A0ABT8WGD1_9FLAO|nr:hypothetical protein [Flavivirga aquimarina]MDO5972113.1 hypothetical protein [Flavivirga aquimarina]
MFPEITHIQNFIATNQVSFWLGKTRPINEKLVPAILKIRNNTYTIHALDEYEDLNYYNPILNFIVVFRSIAIIDESEDFLMWCKLESLDANNHKLLDYYKGICNNIEGINNCFPNNKIDYFVSDLDFQLNAGVMQFLRR